MSCDRYLEVMAAIEAYKLEGLEPIEVMLKTLHKVQDLFNCIPRRMNDDLAAAVGVSVMELVSSIEFYSYFTEDDDLDSVVKVCVGPACRMKGSDSILSSLRKELSDDYSVSEVFCSGRCRQAPAVEVNQRPIDGVDSHEDVLAILT